ncbi:MAG: cytochrome P460 family protein, partial [Anaerolineae bacterium]|nr:cytochrome P460 family protein [Anaerolineae bacterium]
MKMKLPTPLFYIGALLLVLLIAAATSRPDEISSPELPPNPTLMTLPANYRETFVVYAAVDRVDNVTRRLYIAPDALAQWMRGAALPDGTQIIIEAYDVRLGLSGTPLRDDAGYFIPTEISGNIHMAEKRSTWELQDLATSSRVGDWNFASFDPVTFESTSENV